MLKKRGPDGRYVRQISIWVPSKWDNGYTDNRGRFRVYRPDCPRAYKDGYALRAHVVWWLHHNKQHPQNTELHHKDHNRLNDNIENLVVLTKSQHRILHQENWVYPKCKNCGKKYRLHAWRLGANPNRKYCSQECKHIGAGKNRRRWARLQCAFCSKTFVVKPHQKHRKFCSNSCSANHRWHG